MEEFRNPGIDWAALSPVLVLLGGAAVVLLGALFLPAGARRPLSGAAAVLTLLAAGAAAGILLAVDDTGRAAVAGAIRRDRLAEVGQILVAGSALLAVGVSYGERDSTERVGDYYALLLSAAAGMAFFVQANNLMTLFLGLEWFSISLYILTAIAVDRLPSLEAGLKYLIVGSFGSAILLFGSALVYGATGELQFAEIARAAPAADRLTLVAGLAMILVGLGFKVSAAPFHMWTPDVYQGAPTPVTAFMSAATKVAALIVTMRVLVEAFPSERDLWTVALAVIVCVSLAWGNLAALVQADVKRMLAYSSVSHAGFLLMPLAAGNEFGGWSLLYYLVPYAPMSLGAFAIVAIRERELARPVTFANLAGFGWERPFLGLAMAILMFGFIGLPPTGLFFGKFFAFSAAYERGWIWLVIVGVVATIVSIYYYLNVVRMMFFAPPELRVAPVGGAPPRDLPLQLAVAASLVVAIGSLFAVNPLRDLMNNAVAFLDFPF
ncbi:MAG: NADH-quinone oxidoreductase subunit N [Actinomycetota bacterium]|nr:NADH-quinone oxidoreductase subunit N [Actinomycetota bacterium]